MTVHDGIRRRRRKQYPLNQCPFFKVESKDKLADLLGLRLDELQALVARPNNYKIFTIEEKKDITGRVRKPRPVQQPIGDMAKVHKRVYVLLSRIEVPEYLHSAVRGRSYISNARAHLGPMKVIKLDITRFYPSTKRHHVFGFFRSEMCCGEDAAALLAKLCTWNGVLPTGSPISTHLSFFAHRKMFEEVALLATRRGLIFSVYVDDLVLSGPAATRALLRTVEDIVRRNQLSVRSDKSKIFPSGASKIITGVVVDPKGIRVPYERHRKIRLLEEALMRRNGLLDRLPILESLVGVLGEASQIEPRFRSKLFKHASSLDQARGARDALAATRKQGASPAKNVLQTVLRAENTR